MQKSIPHQYIWKLKIWIQNEHYWIAICKSLIFKIIIRIIWTSPLSKIEKQKDLSSMETYVTYAMWTSKSLNEASTWCNHEKN